MVRVLLVGGVLAVAMPLTAFAQRFNIDLEVDHIAPSDGFGGAAGQKGSWYSLEPGLGSVYLTDIHGNATDVLLTATEESDHGTGTTGGNNPLNTGDFAALLNDAQQFGTLKDGGHYTFTFTGLRPGDYTVFTYAASPFENGESMTPVFVEGSISQNPQIVTGPMPGNAFELGITHSVHELEVTDGTLRVVFDVPPNQKHGAFFEGFQVVPAPGTALGLTGLGMLARRRR